MTGFFSGCFWTSIGQPNKPMFTKQVKGCCEHQKKEARANIKVGGKEVMSQIYCLLKEEKHFSVKFIRTGGEPKKKLYNCISKVSISRIILLLPLNKQHVCHGLSALHKNLNSLYYINYKKFHE